MKISCQRCNSDAVFEIPEFSLDEKMNLLKIHKMSPLKAVMELRKLYNTTHKDAKFIINHINLESNTCFRCHTPLDQKEYISCPKCAALNFNWKVSS